MWLTSMSVNTRVANKPIHVFGRFVTRVESKMAKTALYRPVTLLNTKCRRMHLVGAHNFINASNWATSVGQSLWSVDTTVVQKNLPIRSVGWFNWLVPLSIYLSKIDGCTVDAKRRRYATGTRWNGMQLAGGAGHRIDTFFLFYCIKWRKALRDTTGWKYKSRTRNMWCGWNCK